MMKKVLFALMALSLMVAPAVMLAAPVAAVGPVLVYVDINPTSCSNPLNLNSKGVLPVAILGTADFDVTQIDPATVLLHGVAPLRWALEDVAASSFDCTEGPDGYLDLTLKFNTQEVVDALCAANVVNDGERWVLPLMGELEDGTAIMGGDAVFILKKGK
jgi:hypothetical protein